MAWSKDSRQSRGYGAAWEQIRKRIIARDMGLCQICLRQGRTTKGKEVDHITPKAQAKLLGWTQEQIDADEQLQLLCKPCHRRKTDEENGRKHDPRPKIGADGWPID